MDAYEEDSFEVVYSILQVDNFFLPCPNKKSRLMSDTLTRQ